jgi:C-terminal processing protease CtpA/Prc
VYTDNSSIQVGDVIKSINGSDIYSIRDNLRKYIAGSNDPVIERNINKRILAGPLGEVKLVLEDAEGQKIVTLTRNIYISDYYDLIESTEPIWKIIESDSGKFGYVDMGRLEVHHINNMFSALWETDGIIFDIRNYPQGTMWKMVNYLFDGPIHIANFTTPDITYPGTLFWHFEHVGWGDFSQTYNKPIFILFDETTQSQAEYTVMAFEQHPQAHKIGSQTSGADGNVTSIKLPGGIITYFTALGTFYPDFTNTQRIGIIPDVEVHPTIAGVREGRDEVLEVALQYNIINSVEDNISNQIHISNLYLHQNYPNPFNSSTSIEFTLPKPEYVKLKVYNILGKEVATLVAKKLNQGNHTYQFDGSNLASGVYYYQLEAGDFMEVKKMILLK